MANSEGCRLRKVPDKNGAESNKTDKTFRPDKPVHKPSESLLSEAFEQNSFSGYIIWALTLLSAAFISLLLENLRNGIRINPRQWLYYITGTHTGGLESLLIYMLLYTCVPAIVCLFIEKGLAKNKIPQKVGIIAHVLNISQLMILPGVVAYIKSSTFSTVGSTYVSIIYFAQFFKLWSYIHVNHWCRVSRESSNIDSIKRSGLNYSQTSRKKDSLIQYPDNLVFKDMAYFFFAPTICYELNFPRTNGIRIRFLLKCLLEVILLIVFILCLCEQWLAQSIRTTLITHFYGDDLFKKVEFDLKLSIPAHLLWLAWFYGFFHSSLNLVAELMYFGDRTFYLDWWNATNISIYWTKWNVPVHRWCLRHIYIPMRGLGYSRNVSLMAVFFLSAFFHEYFLCVSVKIFESLIFIGWLLQVPAIFISSWIERRFGSTCGIITVAVLCVFSPYKFILTYYHKYLITHYGESSVESYATT